MNKIHILDFEKLSLEVIAKIKSGDYYIFNGVVRDTKGAIVEHIPTKILEFSAEELQNIPACIKKAQGVSLAATALSTTVILGAIVVATTIIVNKLNEIQNSIDEIKKELQDQNQFQYFLQLKDYVAVSESLRELLNSPECIEENRDLIGLKLNEVSIKRHGLILTFKERIRNVEKVSPEHKEQIITFLENTITLLPKIAYLESEGAKAIGKYKLSETINEQFSPKYKMIENSYRLFLEDELNKSLRAESNLSKVVLENLKKTAEIEFKVNESLLYTKEKYKSLAM